MSGELASRYFLTVGVHDVDLYPIDAENFAVFIDGDYEASFAGYRAAHKNAVKRVNENDGFSETERAVVADLTKWSVETVDTSDPERN